MKNLKNIGLSLLGIILILALVRYNSTIERGSRILKKTLLKNEVEFGSVSELIDIPFDKLMFIPSNTEKSEVEKLLGHKFLAYKKDGERKDCLVFFLDKRPTAYIYNEDSKLNISKLGSEIELIKKQDFSKFTYSMETINNKKVYVLEK